MKKLNLISPFCFRSIVLLILITINVTAQPQWISSQVSSNNGNSSSNNPQFNRPSGVLAGDLLLVVITKEKGSQTTYNTPNGWTLISNTNNSDRIGMTTYYRIVGSNEPSSYSFIRNSSTSSGLYTASITVIRGVNPNDPLGNTNTSTGNSSTHASPAVTGSLGSLVVSLHTVNSTSAQTQSGTNMTERFQYRNGSNATWSQFMGTFETTVAGNTGTRTTTSGGTRRFVTQQLEFKSKLCPDSVSGVNTLTSASVVCPSTSVTLSLNTPFTQAGISYQWQSAAVGTSNWQNITDATSATFNALITEALQFRCRIACESLEAFSSPVSVTLNPNTFNCYCTVGSPTDDATGITEVVFHTLNQTSTGIPAYTSYLDNPATIVESGSSYSMNVRVNTAGNYTVSTSVWFDWNQNGIFEDTERLDLGTATNQTNGLTSLSPLAIPIPSQALAGETVMRIRTTYNTNPTACGNQNYSEAEDYKIRVVKPQSWLGLTSSNWNDGSNWSEGIVPTAETVVSIGMTPFQPEITTHAQAYSLTVNTGGSLVVKNAASLTIQGAVSVAADATMLLENGANLVQVQNVSNSGSIRVQKSTRSLLRLDYVIWSSPVLGSQTLKQFSPQTLDNRFYAHQLPSNTWEVANNQLPFASAKGYMIRVPNTHPTTPTVWTGQFVGTPQNGTLTVSMPAPRNNNQNRYFLVGNPYPSALDMKQFLDINAANITGVYYFYRKTNGVAGRSGYFIKSKNPNYNPNDPTSPRFLFTNNGEGIDQNVIPSGQGFFVEMAQGASQIVFTNAMRVAVESGVLNRDAAQEAESNRYTLNLTDTQGGFSQIQVGHYEATTAAYDSGFDSPAFEDSSLLLGSLIANQAETFAVQALEAFDASVTVPLRFKTQTAGTFTLTLAEVSGLFAQEGTQVMLEDLTSGALHSLTEAPFVFTSEAGDFTSRFRIVYQQTTLGLENPIALTSQTLAYAQEGNLYVKSSQESIRAIAVYNLQGQLLTKNLAFTDTQNVQMPLQHVQGQLVLVQIQTADGKEKTHKVWVN